MSAKKSVRGGVSTRNHGPAQNSHLASPIVCDSSPEPLHAPGRGKNAHTGNAARSLPSSSKAGHVTGNGKDMLEHLPEGEIIIVTSCLPLTGAGLACDERLAKPQEFSILTFMDQTEMFDLPKAKIRKLGPIETLKQIGKMAFELDGLAEPAVAAKFLGVSNQRVHQLIACGLLETVQVGDLRYVTGRSVITRIEQKQAGLAQSGRPEGAIAA